MSNGSRKVRFTPALVYAKDINAVHEYFSGFDAPALCEKSSHCWRISIAGILDDED
jgi:hypothetical protein